ncbi:asparagine synthase-related protein [Streptomyces sp. NPDC051578]|uniref:asparagine synthase-related protein n=1 Tax=Streptomyces sp. NPDC051578 TaxID=3365662 RepID=UPI0037A7D61A
MCGIAGRADWERDLTQEKDTVEAMTQTMVCRGPDAAGTWLSLCVHRLVEYAWNIPWSLHTADGVQKSVLRRAARGLVPDAIVDRPKSAFPSGVGSAYLAATRGRARALLADRSSPVLALIDTDAVAGMVRATESGSGSFSPPPMLPRILQLDAWLRRYRVDVVL